MRTVLVTGAIGSGKSEVCRHLAGKGRPVYDCDSRCKGLYESVPGLRQRIEEALGVPFESIGIIFRDQEKRLRLEAVVYPLLLEDFHRWRASQQGNVVYMESAVALDKPEFRAECDEVLLVRAPYATRLGRNPRVAERDALQAFDPSLADYVIDNDSSIEELHKKVDNYENRSC